MLKIKKIRYHRWFNTAEERFSNHKVRPTGIIQTEVQVYTRTHTDTHTDYLKKKQDKRGTKEIPEEIMDEKFLNLMKDINPQIPDVLANPKPYKQKENYTWAYCSSTVKNKR